MRRRRHAFFFFALAAGVVVLVPALVIVPALAFVLAAITLFAVYLTLVAIALPRLSASFLRAKAAEADAPVAIIFAVIVGVVATCCVTLFMALNGGGTPAAVEVGLSIVSVLLGWFTIHAMVAHHYAYEYYGVPRAGPGGKKDRKAVVGGLDFPTGEEPDGGSFLYFSYVIGMTAQVADVSVTSRAMQRIVLFHGIFSFFFNTVILAATVNVAVTLGGA